MLIKKVLAKYEIRADGVIPHKPLPPGAEENYPSNATETHLRFAARKAGTEAGDRIRMKQFSGQERRNEINKDFNKFAKANKIKFDPKEPGTFAKTLYKQFLLGLQQAEGYDE